VVATPIAGTELDATGRVVETGRCAVFSPKIRYASIFAALKLPLVRSRATATRHRGGSRIACIAGVDRETGRPARWA
jgi:hypothetical protein